MSVLKSPGRVTQSWLAKKALVAKAAYIPVSELVDIPGIPSEKWASWRTNFLNGGVKTPTTTAVEAVKELSVAEIEAEQLDRFSVIQKLARGVIAGNIRSLFLTGGAGMGKSHTIYQTFLVLEPEGEDIIWTFVSGKMGQSGLFKSLYDNRESGQVLVVDDADGFLKSEDALNIIKAATDTKLTRRISWNTEYQFVSEKTGEPIPKSFEFRGALVVISNKNFHDLAAGNGKLQEHYEAIIDRASVVSVDIESQRDRIIRLRTVARSGQLFADLDLSKEVETEILEFIEENAERMNRISFRTAIKIGGYRKHNPNDWRKLAKVTEFTK